MTEELFGCKTILTNSVKFAVPVNSSSKLARIKPSQPLMMSSGTMEQIARTIIVVLQECLWPVVAGYQSSLESFSL